MDIRLSYTLIAIVYVMNVIVKLLTIKINTSTKTKIKEYPIYKRDFLWLIVISMVLVTALITVLCFTNQTPYNINAPILSVLLIGAWALTLNLKFMMLEDNKIFLDGEIINIKVIREILYDEKLLGSTKYIIYVRDKNDNLISHEFYSRDKDLKEILVSWSKEFAPPKKDEDAKSEPEHINPDIPLIHPHKLGDKSDD